MEIHSEYEEGEFSVDFWDDYQIVQCRGCQAIRFRHEHRNSEDARPDPETGEWRLVSTTKLYPIYNESREPLHHAELLPHQVQAIYRETLNALNASLPVLAGVGLRALVETICRDRSAKGKNLEAKIDSLVLIGAVSAEGAEVLHSLRIMGNAAAHEVKPHKAEDLHVALDVVEHTLQGAYILPKEAKRLPRRARVEKTAKHRRRAT